MEDFLSSLLVFFVSTTKFLAGVVASLGFQQGLLPSYVSTVGGGIIGVFVFTFFGELVNKWFNKLFPNRTKRKFTSWNRVIVRIKRSFGLSGIAMLTPLLSVPVGIFLSLSMEKNKWRITLFMAISFLIWTTVIFVPYYLFDINIKELVISLKDSLVSFL